MASSISAEALQSFLHPTADTLAQNAGIVPGTGTADKPEDVKKIIIQRQVNSCRVSGPVHVLSLCLRSFSSVLCRECHEMLRPRFTRM